jgi:uncharacterized protein YodC (DUF2158 family)
MRTKSVITMELGARRREIAELNSKVIELEEELLNIKAINKFEIGDIFKCSVGGTVMIISNYSSYCEKYLFSGSNGDSAQLYSTGEMTAEGVLEYLNEYGYVFVRNGNSKI